MALATIGTYTGAAAPRVAAPDPYTTDALNRLYGLINPGTTNPVNPYASVLASQPGAGTTPTAAALKAAPKLSAPAGTFTLPNGNTINYTTLLQNDPLLQQQLAQVQAANASDQQALNAGEQQALIGYGAVPTNVASIPGLAGAVDQTTQDLANQNTAAGLSTTAKLKNAYQQAVQATNSSLAARGLLRSGAFGQDNAQDLLGYNQAQDTAVQQLNQYLSGLYNGYLTQQQALQQQEYGAYEQALQNLIAEIQAGLITGNPTTTTTTTTDAAHSTGTYPAPSQIGAERLPLPGLPVYA